MSSTGSRLLPFTDGFNTMLQSRLLLFHTISSNMEEWVSAMAYGHGLDWLWLKGVLLGCIVVAVF